MPAATKQPVNPPVPPQLAAYEPYEAEPIDEPVFEQLHLVDVQEWPAFDPEPWRFDTCKLERCTFMGQTIPTVRLWDSVLVRCDLSTCKLFEAGWLRNEFLGCRLTGLQLGESTVKDVTFQNCKLDMVSFRKCKLERVVFQNCILDNSDFNGAHLTDVVFTKCELSQTDFSDSKSLRVDLSGSYVGNLKGVMSLKGVRIAPEQMIELAPLLCAEVGLQTI